MLAGLSAVSTAHTRPVWSKMGADTALIPRSKVSRDAHAALGPYRFPQLADRIVIGAAKHAVPAWPRASSSSACWRMRDIVQVAKEYLPGGRPQHRQHRPRACTLIVTGKPGSSKRRMVGPLLPITARKHVTCRVSRCRRSKDACSPSRTGWHWRSAASPIWIASLAEVIALRGRVLRHQAFLASGWPCSGAPWPCFRRLRRQSPSGWPCHPGAPAPSARLMPISADCTRWRRSGVSDEMILCSSCVCRDSDSHK